MILAHWLRSVARRNPTTRTAARPAATLRRTRRLRSLVVAGQVELLEERALLSAVAGQLDTHGKVLVNGVEASDHGVVVTNAKAAGKTAIDINSTTVSQYAAAPGRGLSGNANGSGLYVNLDNSGGTLNALKTLSVTNVTVSGNGNAGIQINLKNIALDKLVIDRAVVTGNAGAGLLLNFTNVSIKQLIIYDSANPAANPLNPSLNATNSGASRFANNGADGVYVSADGLTVSTVMRVAGNVADGNGTAGVGAGMWFNLIGATIANLDFNDNEVGAVTNPKLNPAAAANSGSGVLFDFNRTKITTGQVVRNTIKGNGGHGMAFAATSVLGGAVTPAPSTVGFAAFSDNTFDSNGASGLGLDLQAQTVWQGTLLRNTFRANQRLGLSVVARDTVGAFDIVVGGLTIDQQTGQFVNANTFANNVGAGISLQLVDTNDNVGDTTGRFRIYGNTITGTSAIPGTYGGLTYLGEGINIRGIGRDDKKNGAARFFGSVIDRNTITGNAGDGVRAELQADSEMLDLTIGNNAGVNQTFDVNGATEPNGEDVPTRQGNGNVITGNGRHGVEIIRSNTAVVAGTRILDNRVTGNAGEGLYLQALNSFQTLPTSARPNLKVVTDFTIENNDLSNNGLSGVHLHTELDAVLRADLRYNRIDANAGNGVRLSGRENNTTDFENIGGTWVKNAITNNGLNGVAIETVVGSVNPLVIGREGRDSSDRQSLGNYIAANAQDGIEIGARVFPGGLVVPRDVKDGAEIVNNLITGNGTASSANPYLAGKGVDIEVLELQPREFRIDHNVIRGNFGDGIELDNRGGQLRFSGLANTIEGNGGRGVDLLNQGGMTVNSDAEGYVRFGDAGNYLDAGQQILDDNGIPVTNRNLVSGNGLEGIYVVNTLAPLQTQDVDATVAMVTEDRDAWVVGTYVNLILDLDTNDVRANGGGSPITGTGLVIRVGTQNSATAHDVVPDIGGTAPIGSNSAAAGVGTNTFSTGGSVEAGYRVSANGRVNARVVDNNFAGNAGDDVYVESFVSAIPNDTPGVWTAPTATPPFRVDGGYERDPLARLNLVFTGNTGDSLDVTRVGASYTNAEGTFKRRDTSHQPPDPPGPFASGAWPRVAQRVADRPVSTNGYVYLGPDGFFYEDGTLASAYGSFSGIDSETWGAPFAAPNTPQVGFGTGVTGGISVNPSVTDENGAIIVTATSRTGRIGDVQSATVGGVNNVAVVTSLNHGLNTGDRISITGVGGTTALNTGSGTSAYWTVERISTDTFAVRDPISGQYILSNAAYTSGGSWTLLRGGTVTAATNTDPTLVTLTGPTFAGHGLTTGDNITISGATGNTAINNGIVPTVAITAATNTNPAVITSNGHGLTDGEEITIAGALGNTAINGNWVVANATANTFELRDITTGNAVAGNGNYLGGATWRRSYAITAATNASPALITSPAHGLTDGEWVNIFGAQGNTNINGTWVVDVLDPDTFRLQDPVTGNFVAGNAAYTGGGRWSRANPTQWTVEVVNANTVRLKHPNTGAYVAGNGAFSGFVRWGGGRLGAHGLVDGAIVTITGTGMGLLDGVHAVRVLDSSSFSLYVPNSSLSFATTGGTIASAVAASNADPVVITSPAHGLTTGARIMIAGALGNTSLNTDATPANPGFSNPLTPNPSYWLVEVLDANTFQLRNPETGAVLLGNGTTYANNSGSWQQIVSNLAIPVRGKGAVTAASNTNPVVITAPGNGLSDGDQITIAGATGNTAINGTWTVELIRNENGEIDIDSFRLRDAFGNYAVGNGAYTGGATWTLTGGRTPLNPSYVVHNVRGTLQNSFVNGKFHYDGLGPSTFRIESSWDVSGFRDNGLTVGGLTNPGDNFSYESLIPNSITTFAWDTVKTGTFSYLTAWVDDATVSEADGTATVKVHLSEDAPTGGLLVRYRTSDGTAKAGDGDYDAVQFTTQAQAKAISSAVAETTLAGPAVRITSAAHGLRRGDRIVITGAQGDPGLNGTWDVEVVNANQFRLVNPATGQYATTNGAYVPGSAEFVPVQNYGFVFIPEGQREGTITVKVNTDLLAEPDEQFYIDLEQISTGDFVDTRGVVRVTEPPHVTITDAQVVEGDNGVTRQMRFTVTLSSVPASNVSVAFSVAPGTATAADYQLVTASPVQFPANTGQLSQDIVVDITGDNLLEGTETFTVNLDPVATTGAVIDDAQAVGTIIDNDTPDVSVSDVVVNEGDGTATFTVTLSKAVGVPVTVQYATSNGSAVAGQDYTARSNTVTVPANQLSATFTVSITDDTLLESDETFVVTLSNPTNATIADGTGVATIKDNDSPTVTIGPAVTGSQTVVTEGDPGQNLVARFKLTLDKAPAQAVSVTVKTVDYTAKAGQDFTAVNKVVTFAANQTEAFVDVPIVNDLTTEGFEQFFVAVVAGNGVSIGNPSYTAAGIYDNDTPTISASPIGVIETDGSATFTVTLSKAVSNPVGVSYAITGGTATAGTDFTAGPDPLSGALTFAPGETVKTITINVVNDGVDEPTETFFLNLGGASNGAIDPNSYKVLGKIIDPSNALVSFAVGSGPGSSAAVKVYDAFGRERSPNAFSDIPGVYTSAFMSGINVAVGDVNGDGIGDIIVAPQKSNTPAPIRVFEGKSLGLMASFFPFADTYTGGVSIAVGDIDPQNANGLEIFAATSTGASAVGVFRVSQFAPTASKLVGFSAFPGASAALINGIDIAVADVVGNDGRAEVVVAPNGGAAGPAVRVLDWTGGFLNSFYAFDPSYTGGVNVAAGDVNGDGQAEVIASLQAGNPPLVRVFNALSGGLLTSFFAYSPSFTGGVSVGTGDVNFDGRADILTAPASGSVVAVYARDGLTGAVIPLGASPSGSVTPQTWNSFTGGATVGGQLFPLPFGSSLAYAGAAVNNPNAAAVTQAQARNLAKAAMSRLAAAGASAADIARLAKAQVVVADLGGSRLGNAVGNTVVIDVNAAGVGWFIDSTPGRDEEFARGADGVYRAIAPRAAGKVDLLTVLTHELAHLIGFEDLSPTASPNALMTGTLPQGVRRATREQLDDLFADDATIDALLTA